MVRGAQEERDGEKEGDGGSEGRSCMVGKRKRKWEKGLREKYSGKRHKLRS